MCILLQISIHKTLLAILQNKCEHLQRFLMHHVVLFYRMLLLALLSYS